MAELGTLQDPSVVEWLAFHETHERLDVGYRYVFEHSELDEIVRCHGDSPPPGGPLTAVTAVMPRAAGADPHHGALAC